MLWFPTGLFRLPSDMDPNSRLTYKSSIRNVYLTTREQSSHYLIIQNQAQSSSPTGAPIPANSPCTITVFGLIMDSPRANNPNSVMITTSADAAANTAVDSGFIGFGSYVNGSCPYGFTWHNSAESCLSCGTKVCGDFDTCFQCVGCPEGQTIQQSDSFRVSVQKYWESVQESYISSVDEDLPSLALASLSYYACSNSSSLCPAGSGKQDGDSGGCLMCPANQFNDGTSAFCRFCPSPLYPSFQTRNRRLYRGASACSSHCPQGTATLKSLTYQAVSGVKRYEQRSDLALLGIHSTRLGGEWMNLALSMNQNGNLNLQACFPCSLWQIVKDNTCQPCGAGATDRAALNSLGNSFSFATECVPDICPWPYVVAAESLMNEIALSDFDPRTFPASTPPERSALAKGVCNVNVHLGGTNATIAMIATFMFGCYILAIYLAAEGDDEALTTVRRRRLIVGMLLSTVSPCIDFVSDLMYIVSTLFSTAFFAFYAAASSFCPCSFSGACSSSTACILVSTLVRRLLGQLWKNTTAFPKLF